MTDDLRARLAGILATAAASFVLKDFERVNARHGEGNGGHSYDGACALCRGEIGTLLDAIMPVGEDAIHQAKRPPGTCRECWEPWGTDGFLHHVSCSQYVGPVWHRCAVESRRGDVGERLCACGAEWTVPRGISTFEWDCPNATETWRGPMPFARDLSIPGKTEPAP